MPGGRLASPPSQVLRIAAPAPRSRAERSPDERGRRMILFELRCSQGHVFEAWFRDNATYDEQAQAGAITCVICGDGKVGKALMAPALGRRAAFRGDPRHQDPGQPAGSPGAEAIEQVMPSGSADPPRLDQERTAAALRALRDVQNHIEEWDVYAVTKGFQFQGMKLQPGELVAYVRRENGNEVNAATQFRHLQRLQ